MKKYHQIGKSDKVSDYRRSAELPGKRKSKSGHVYYEYRKNRSDMPHSKV